MPLRLPALWLCLWLSSFHARLLGQHFDLALDRLYPVPQADMPPEGSLSATVRVASDGAYLFVYIHVRDAQVQHHAQTHLADHIELSLGLPAEAYPDDFEYNLHPQYVSAPDVSSRGSGEVRARLFSLYSEFAAGLSLSDFLDNHDYPRQGSEVAPPARTLRLSEVHHGLMRYALFPDERPPEHLNRDELTLVEETLGHQMGEVTPHVVYQVTRQDTDGYEINARLSPEALGFATLPEVSQLHLLVRVFDVARPGEAARPVLSTMPAQREDMAEHPANFNRLRLQRPLYTNFTTIPDYVFRQADYHPVCFYAQPDWIATSIDVDALVYGEQQASQTLTEVGFLPETFAHGVQDLSGIQVERLAVERQYVNEMTKSHTYYLLMEQVLETERIKGLLGEPSQVQDQFFRFPDGAVGAIVRSSTSVDPYGWGPCGTCVEETIRIYRITRQGKEVLLDIFQGDGPNAYCQVREIMLKDYYLLETDWIKPGEILVLRLNHRYLTTKKRIKVSWKPDGTGLAVESID